MAFGTLCRADISTGNSFTVEGVTELVDWAYQPGGQGNIGYDIHPDGDRFVAVSGSGANVGSTYIVVSWFTELRERMGAN